MPTPNSRLERLQRLWRNIHLCIGAGLLLLLGSIAITGALLVWKGPLDALMHPARYAVTLGAAQPASVYLTDAAQAGVEPFAMQFADDDAGPVVVNARRGGNEPGARPSIVTVYLDPPTGRVLEVVDSRTSLFGLLHRFHENLTIPEYYGRSIVGWTGVAMLTSIATGLYLWWPRQGGVRRGMRWRRGPGLLSNLHHMIGIWIAAPLAVVALTGIYLGFPQQGRSLLSSLAAMTPPERGGFASPLLRPTERNIDQALDAALTSSPGGRPAAISLPTRQRPAWRIELRGPGADQSTILLVDDNSGAVSRIRQLAGDRAAMWIRWIHEGSHAGWPWRVVVFLCGLFLPTLGISGVIIWLQRRRIAKSPKLHGMSAGLRPAE